MRTASRKRPPGRAGCRWSAVAGAILIVLLGAAAPSTLRALPHESEVWIRAETAHFTLFSNVSRKYTLEIGHQLELFRHVLAGLNPDFEMNSPLPTYVFLFRNAQSFNPYKTLIFDADMSRDKSIGTADFMTIWNQGLREGLFVHWDGNNPSVQERNLSAAIGAAAPI